MTPTRANFPNNDSAFHRNLSKADLEQLLTLQSIRELPKSRYATQSCITALLSHRGRKAIYSHIEIYKMVEDIATNLRAAGVRPQTVCAFILETSIEAIVYLLALQWIKAIAVPIDPSLSSDQISSILTQSHSFTVVSALVDKDEQDDNEQFQKIHNVCQQLKLIEWHISRSTNEGVFLDMGGKRAGEGAAWAGGAADFKFDPSEISVRCASSINERALQVELTHRNLASATRTFANIYDLSDNHTTLLVAPFYTIQGLMCVLATMYAGGHVIIPASDDIDPQQLLQLANTHHVTWFSTSPEHLTAIYEELDGNPSLLNGVDLAFVRVIGESLEPDLVRRIEPALQAPILEGYGTTETCGLITANKELDFRLGTYGRAVPGCKVAILDLETEDQVEYETEGYIAVSGDHVMKGFSNDDDANSEHFLEIDVDGDLERFFLTGDTGHMSSDGYLVVHKAVSNASESESEVGAVEEVETREYSEDTGSIVRKGTIVGISDSDRDEEVGSSGGTGESTSSVMTEESSLESGELSIRTATHSRALQSDSFVIDRDSERLDSKEHTGLESTIDNDLLLTILQKLETIEKNQEQWEEQMGQRLAIEVANMTKDVQVENEENKSGTQTILVNMEEINAAVISAAASAENSSQNSACAANAAKEAAASAVAAATSAGSIGCEGRRLDDTTARSAPDGNCLQKTILVSLDDVEEAMQLHVSVDVARAFGRPDAKMGQEVFCAIKPKKGARVSEPWLKMHAQSMLPAAFVPRRFFYKDDLSANEKRSELSGDANLKRVSLLSGYSDARVIKGPAWAPQQSA